MTTNKLDTILESVITEKMGRTYLIEESGSPRDAEERYYTEHEAGAEYRAMLIKRAKQAIEAYIAERESKIINWATGDDTGVSSKAIMRHMSGQEPQHPWGFMPPADSADRGRCIRLLNLFPEWWDRLDEMLQYRGWQGQVPMIKEQALKSNER